ncbi:hypothetical protein ACRHK7_00065 [Weissella tructae]|jgi:hypothetical protein|uniref:Uncharacterized protein n=2 Tax=Weissella TaxID=46255 RepID=A0A075TZL5_9LACO|nr:MULTISPECIES: hypothetical protein [Weissella]AIG65328.1 hypothetical protein WS08_0389 [Weissella tructae]AIM62642.1 hypothetical protein WS74_0390 [Weissella ceti]AIM63977.1 hypothetical protein WS105_0387 [Weissella ceti]
MGLLTRRKDTNSREVEDRFDIPTLDEPMQDDKNRFLGTKKKQ